MLRESQRYAEFVARRERLNRRLIESGKQVDQWVEEHKTGEATVRDLAMLEGLLFERREFLSELSRLDDSFMKYLLELRNSPQD